MVAASIPARSKCDPQTLYKHTGFFLVEMKDENYTIKLCATKTKPLVCQTK